MENYRLPSKFNFNFDGNMQLAKYIVSVHQSSNDFMLDNYPLKKDFYIDSLSTYDEYLNLLLAVAMEYDVDMSDNILNILNNIRDYG